MECDDCRTTVIQSQIRVDRAEKDITEIKKDIEAVKDKIDELSKSIHMGLGAVIGIQILIGILGGLAVIYGYGQ